MTSISGLEELIARLRECNVIRSGETIMLDIGHGPTPVSTGDIVQYRNPDGPEAADTIAILRDALFEARKLTCDAAETGFAKAECEAIYAHNAKITAVLTATTEKDAQ